MEKTFAAAILAGLFAAGAFAADRSCETSASQKNLDGRAKSDFVMKCVNELCEASAAQMKLTGAAAATHIRKCRQDKTPK